MKRSLASLLVLLHLVTFSVPLAWADGDGPIVMDVNGNVLSQNEGATTNVNVFDGSALKVLNSDIPQDHVLNINILNSAGLPDANAKAIFNIEDGHASAWEGILNLIGTGAFINKAGFDIAQTFQANITGGAILSTLGISQSDFFSGMAVLARELSQNPVAIANKGTWNLDNGSFVAMVGSAIHNEGNIIANGGAAILAAGDKVTLDISGGDGLISVAIDKPVEATVLDFQGNKITDAISNSGSIQANGGIAILTAKAAENIFDNVINHTGLVEANSISNVNGQIILNGGDRGIVSVGGILKAQGDNTNEQGGLIHVLGEKVGLFANALLNASGFVGGGTILIGGDYQGLGSVQNAKAVYVSPNAHVSADATLEGDGGKIVVWSDGSTQAYGSFSARGGLIGGNGGLIETSGKEGLDVSGVQIDASAPAGNSGKWLLDPFDVEIVAGLVGALVAGVFTPVSNSSKIGATTIVNVLNAGTSVEINTGSSGSQQGNIKVSALISMSTAAATIATLTLKAANNIVISSSTGITAASAAILNVVLEAIAGDITISSAITTNGGTVTMNSADGIALNNTNADITTAGGTLTAHANTDADNPGDFNMSNSGSSLSTNGGLITIDGRGVTLNGTVSSGAANINLTAAATDVVIGNTMSTNQGNILINAADGVTLNDANSDVTTNGGSFTANSNTDADNSGDFNMSNSGSSIDTSGNGGGAISANGLKINLNGTLNSGGKNVDLTATKDTVTVGKTLTTGGGNLTLNAADDVVLSNANSDITTSGGSYTVDANTDGDSNGDYRQTNAGSSVNTANGNISITANDFILDGTHNSGNGSTSLLLSRSGTTLRLGSGGSSLDADISGTELQNLTANGLTIGGSNAATISVRGITAANSNNISGTTTLSATSGTGTVTFDTAASTFNTLAVNAGNGATFNQNVTTDTGSMTVNADSDASGAGDFNVATGVTLNTSGKNFSVTANNFILTGTGAINAGAGIASLITSKAGTTVGLGGGTGTFNVTDAEADQITASSIEIGAANAGNIKVDNFSPANSSKLILRTGGSLTEEGAGDAAADIVVTNLGVESATGVNVDVNVTNLGVKNSGAGGVNITDTAGGLTVGSITNSGTAISGVSTAGGGVTLVANSPLTINSAVSDSNGGNIELTASGATAADILTLNADVTTTGDLDLNAGGAINQTGGKINADDVDFTAGGASTLNQSSNDFNTINGTAVGAIDIADSVSNTEIKSLATVGNSIDYNHTGTGDVTVTGTVSSGNGTTNGGNIEVNSSNALTINNTATLSTAIGAGGVLSVTGAVVNGTLTVGAGNLTLNGVSLLDTIINTPINDVVNVIITALRDIILQSSITTTNNANVTLTADSDLDGSGGVWIQSAGSINSDGTVTLTGSDIFATASAIDSIRVDSNGANDQIFAQGDIMLEHSSAAPADSSIIIEGHVTSAAGNVQITSKNGIELNGVDADIVTTGNFTANVDSDANAAGDFNMTAGSSVNVGAGNISIEGADADLGGTLTGTGTLTLQPSTVNRSIGIGDGAGDFDLNDSDLGNLTNGFSSIAIGRADGAHDIHIDSSIFNDAVAIQAPAAGGHISVDGTIQGTEADASITLDGPGSTTDLSANIITTGAAINLSDAFNLLADVLLDTTNGGAVATGAAISLTTPGTIIPDITSAHSLSLRAGTAGDITIGGTIGTAALLVEGLSILSAHDVSLQALNLYSGGLSIDNINRLILNGDVIADGPISISNVIDKVTLLDNVNLSSVGALSIAASILLSGADGTTNILTSTDNALLNLGFVTATNDVNLTVNSEGDVSLDNTDINQGDLSITLDADDDDTNVGTFGTLDAGSISINGFGADDNLTFNGAVTTDAGNFTINNPGDSLFNSTINTFGDFTQNGGAGTTTFKGAGTISGNVDVTAGAILFDGGSLDANSGAGSVTLTASTGTIDNNTASDNSAEITGGAINLSADSTIGGTNALDFNSNTSIGASTTGDDISLHSLADVVVDLITTGNIAAGIVTLSSEGAIDSLNYDGTEDILAKTINLTALVGGIGTSSILEVSAGGATINADTSADGSNIFLDHLGDAVIGLINAGTGNVTFTSTGTIDSAADDGTADIAGAQIDLNADSAIGGVSTLEVAASTRLNASTTNDNITIDSINDLPLGNVDAGSGDVTLVSEGNITDADDDAAADVTGSIINLTAKVGGIGILANAVDFLASTQFNADTTIASGGDDSSIFVRSTGDAPIGLIDAGFTGDVKLVSEGNITDANDGGTPDAPGVVNVHGSEITLETTGAGDIGEITNYFEIQPEDLWNLTMNGGNPYVACIGPCPMGLIDIGTGTFYYTGNVTDGNDIFNGEINGGLVNLIAGGAHINSANTASGFIGESTNWIEMNLADYAGVAGTDGRIMAAAGTGGIHISNDNPADANLGLQIGGVTPATLTDGLTSTGLIEVYSFSPLFVAANVSNTGGTDINLHAMGSTSPDDLTVDSGVTISATGGNGNILLTAGDDLILNSSAVVSAAGTGGVTAFGGEDYTNSTLDLDGNSDGDVFMDTNSAFRSEDGNITLRAVQNARLTEANADSNADNIRGDVTIEARDGYISDRNGSDVNITGDDLVLRAKLGIGDGTVADNNELETNVITLDAINSTSGHANIVEVSAGGALNVIRAFQQGGGDLNIRTDDGTLSVINAGGFGVSATSGKTHLEANGSGADDDLFIDNTVTSDSGKIELFSNSRDVSMTSAGDITSTSGDIQANAFRDIFMEDGAVANAGSGLIDFDSGRDTTLGSVQTSSGATDAVDINAGGEIIDGGDTDTDIITGASGRATLNAVTGIGSSGALGELDTSIGALDAVNSTSGDLNVTEIETGANLDIHRAEQGGSGEINIFTTNGLLTVLDAASTGLGVLAQAGETRLWARDSDASGGDHLVINNTVTSTSGKINLDSEDDVQFSVEGDVTSGSGEVEVDAFDQIIMSDNGADGTIIDAGSSNIDLDAGGNVNISSLQTTNTSSTAVVVSSRGGAIIDAGDTDVDIKTGALTGGTLLKADSGIGDAGDPFGGLETQTGALAAKTNTGDIQVFNTGALNITTITDPDAFTSQGFAGAGTVAGVSIVDPVNVNNGLDKIFVTTASPMTISSPATNNMGGNISLYALGNTAAETMDVNANVQSIGGNGNIRMASGSSMTMAAGTNISTQGDGVTSGTGQVAIGAGYDATGKASDEPFAAGTTLLLPSATLFDTVGDANANLTMDETSRIWTEDGNILVDAQNNFTVGQVNADGNSGAGITDGIRGNITTFSRNGSTLDAEIPNVGNLDFVANTLNMFSGSAIGASINPIEIDAPFFNAFSVGSVFVNGINNIIINLTSSAGSIFFSTTGNIGLGTAFAGAGAVHLTAGGSILSEGGLINRVGAFNDITLIAQAGVVGTATEPIQTHLTQLGTLTLFAGGQINGLSANILGNFSSSSIQVLGLPPGLVLLGGGLVGGLNIQPLITSSFGTLFFAPLTVGDPSQARFNPFYANDFPGFFNQERFSTTPSVDIDTTGLVAPPVPAPVIPPVPTVETQPQPTPAAKEETKKKTTTPPQVSTETTPGVEVSGTSTSENQPENQSGATVELVERTRV